MLSKGDVIEYERLCVCTGALPKVLFPGHPHVLYIRDTESVRSFQRRIAHAKRILIVGNGGIATEMVYEISGRYLFYFALLLWHNINIIVLRRRCDVLMAQFLMRKSEQIEAHYPVNDNI